MIGALILTGLAAFVLGQCVTERLIRSGGWWSRPLRAGGSMRRANLPVGGTLAASAALFAGAAAPYLLAIAIGFALAAMLYDTCACASSSSHCSCSLCRCRQ